MLCLPIVTCKLQRPEIAMHLVLLIAGRSNQVHNSWLEVCHSCLQCLTGGIRQDLYLKCYACVSTLHVMHNCMDMQALQRDWESTTERVPKKLPQHRHCDYPKQRYLERCCLHRNALGSPQALAWEKQLLVLVFWRAL